MRGPLHCIAKKLFATKLRRTSAERRKKKDNRDGCKGNGRFDRCVPLRCLFLSLFFRSFSASFFPCRVIVLINLILLYNIIIMLHFFKQSARQRAFSRNKLVRYLFISASFFYFTLASLIAKKRWKTRFEK